MFAAFFTGKSLMLVWLKAGEQTLGHSEESYDRGPTIFGFVASFSISRYSP